MYSRQISRFFHLSSSIWSSARKSDLAKLRKKTGYTFANCKKALELNNNDVTLAEKWLKEQAQALGWAKASKLEGRATVQGLVGIASRGSSAVLLEVNCETDFVARNKKFRSLVELCADSCLNYALKTTTHDPFSKISLTSEDIKKFIGPEEKTLVDHTALVISSLGENLNLRRALLVKAASGVHFAIYSHPNLEDDVNKILVGKYVSLVAYKSKSDNLQQQRLARQLCQHVVGMNPSKVGVLSEDEPAENKDDEVVMLHQEFLLDPEITVGQFIENAGINIIDFVRFECGEELSDPDKEVLSVHVT